MQGRMVQALHAIKGGQDVCFLYRLTLVKGWNMAEAAEYARLVSLGQPDFIEVKGVTYCGSSGASSLTMQNVPYHADVCAFGQVRGFW